MEKEEIDYEIELTLKDERNRELIIKVNRSILLKIPYFQPLLTKFKDANSTEISIEVPDTVVCGDIIRFFRGDKERKINPNDWKYHVQYIFCWDFFCLDNPDPSKLSKCDLPKKQAVLDMLIAIARITKNDKIIVELIDKHLERNHNYKFNKDVDKSLLKKLSANKLQDLNLFLNIKMAK